MSNKEKISITQKRIRLRRCVVCWVSGAAFKSFKLSVISLLLLIVLSTNISAQPNLFLYTDSSIIENGSEFDVYINVSNVSDLYGIQFDIMFNYSVLKYISITDGDFLKSDGNSLFVWGPVVSQGLLDNYLVSRTTIDYGLNGSGNLAKIRFKAINKGISYLDILNNKLINSSVDYMLHTAENNSVEVDENLTDIIDVTFSPENLDFGTILPGDTKNLNVTVNNSKSNVDVSVDSVLLKSGGTIFDDLLFNGQVAGSFVPLDISAGSADLIELILNIPVITVAGNQNDVIIYTITGPVP